MSTSGQPVITVNPDREYQTMDGFGASVTGSSAFLVNKRMSGDQRDALMKDLFSPEGIRLSFVRHSVGASDFSVDADGNPASYTYDDTEAGEDYGLEQFSIAKDGDVTGLLQRILDENNSIKVMGTPWTAPPWMKFGEQIHNGWYLNYAEPRVYAAYAQYLARYIKEYEKLGIPIYALTIQNEPEFTTADYPSMSMGAEEQALLSGIIWDRSSAGKELHPKLWRSIITGTPRRAIRKPYWVMQKLTPTPTVRHIIVMRVLRK